MKFNLITSFSPYFFSNWLTLANKKTPKKWVDYRPIPIPKKLQQNLIKWLKSLTFTLNLDTEFGDINITLG